VNLPLGHHDAAARLPVLLQSEAAECGLACLAMVASSHGHSLDLNEIRHRFHVSLKGTTLKDLVSFARTLGFSARALRLEPAALDRLHCPAILHLDMNHFVVLKEMRGQNAIVHDPALGRRRFSADQLDRRFTGIALELKPDEAFRTKPAGPSLGLVDLAGRLPLARSIVPKALILSLAFQLLVLTTPFYVQLVIDRSVSQGDAETLLPLAIGFGLLILLRAAVAWLRTRVLLAFGALLGAQLMSNVVRHMLRLPHGWFESRHVAALLSRISSIQPIRDLISEGFVAAVVDGLMAVLTIAIALFFAPWLALVVLCGFLVSALVKWWQVRRSMERENEYIEAFAKSQQEFIETVRGIATVKVFRKEADRERRWSDRYVEAVNARYAVDLVAQKSDLMRQAVQALVLLLVISIGAGQVIAGATSLGVLMAFITYQQMFADSASKLLDFAGRFRLLDVHLQRLADVIQSEPEQDDSGLSGDSGRPLMGGVAANDLSFRYGDLDEPVFAGISFEVQPGEFVAITGPSGGGKTTLLKLLIGLLQPTSGTVLYDGRPIRTLGLATVRDRIGVVMQDDVLLSGSLGQNITFFDSQPDREWMRECARIAAIDSDIASFPMGYNTLVGDMGTVLSGGQRQRVLLARALYKRPRILFIDEGTSSLDTDKEREVNANLKALDMTRIIIAHRKDTIGAADRILELRSDGIEPRGRQGVTS
jgi:ATP-binding cassette, subfamily B, bacterial CvaB/MchF/RaxB